MAQHNALGLGGAARGVEDVRRRLRVDRARGQGHAAAGFQEIRPGQRSRQGLAGHHDGPQLREGLRSDRPCPRLVQLGDQIIQDLAVVGLEELPPDDQQAEAAMAQGPSELGGLVPGVERHEDSAQRRCGEGRDHPVRLVAEQCADAPAGPYPLRHHGSSRLEHTSIQLAVADHLLAEEDGRGLGWLPGGHLGEGLARGPHHGPGALRSAASSSSRAQ